MDILTLKGLQYEAKHGYYEQERREGNSFEVDLVFYADLKKAGQTDDLNHTIDYQRAEKIVNDIMGGTSLKLIETLAWEIGEHLFDEFNEVEKLEVKVRKLVPPLSTKTKFSEVCMSWNR